MQFEFEKPKTENEAELIEKSICGMWRELLKRNDDVLMVMMMTMMTMMGLPDDGLRLALDWVKGRAPRRRPR